MHVRALFKFPRARPDFGFVRAFRELFRGEDSEEEMVIGETRHGNRDGSLGRVVTITVDRGTGHGGKTVVGMQIRK